MNVLLITADQWRADCLSALGHPVVETPNLDALAARGTRFTDAYCNSPICVPSLVPAATSARSQEDMATARIDYGALDRHRNAFVL